MLLDSRLSQYRSRLLALPAGRPLTKDDLLVNDFLIERHGPVEMYYAPHNGYVNMSARVAIIGITPGWTQMSIAYREAQKGLALGLPDEEIGRRAKAQASFAGAMRRNLIAMLDELGLQHRLRLSSCAALFEENRPLLHTTSVLRYPVFVDKANYTGTRPELMASAFLREAALRDTCEELGVLGRPLIIPLGKTVERVLRELERIGAWDGQHCLWGFPHPSGANGHRHRQFAAQAEQMRLILQHTLGGDLQR